MEAERKRKRQNHRLASQKEEEEVAVEGGGPEVVELEEENVAQPSEEEVDEFFTILRRMHVALKYFEKNGLNVNNIGNCATVKASENVAADVIKSGGGGGVNREVVSENSGLDLNSFPASET